MLNTSPTTTKNSDNPIVPLVLVVEDKDNILTNNISQFKSMGCSAIGFNHSNEVIRALNVLPHVDLILTDLDLSGTGDDKSGVELAKFISAVQPKIPVCGYSAYHNEDQLSEEEKSYFSGGVWAKSSGGGYLKLNQQFENFRAQAIKHRLIRRESLIEKLKRLDAKNIEKNSSLSEVRDLMLAADGADSIDSVLKESNFLLKVVHPEDETNVENSFLIWFRLNEGIIECEVYGYSDLYSYGSTENEAYHSLIELMSLIKSELIDSSDQLSPQVIRLQRFLEFTIHSDE